MNEEQKLPAGSIAASDLAKEEQKAQSRPSNVITLAELERHHIEYALLTFGGNKTQAAKALGISLKTLYNKLHTYGMMEKPEDGK